MYYPFHNSIAVFLFMYAANVPLCQAGWPRFANIRLPIDLLSIVKHQPPPPPAPCSVHNFHDTNHSKETITNRIDALLRSPQQCMCKVQLKEKEYLQKTLVPLGLHDLYNVERSATLSAYSFWLFAPTCIMRLENEVYIERVE